MESQECHDKYSMREHKLFNVLANIQILHFLVAAKTETFILFPQKLQKMKIRCMLLSTYCFKTTTRRVKVMLLIEHAISIYVSLAYYWGFSNKYLTIITFLILKQISYLEKTGKCGNNSRAKHRPLQTLHLIAVLKQCRCLCLLQKCLAYICFISSGI